ncbi:hypothetical protein [Lysobacter gummosus]|uniref:hypothetical protein n=1 Tax=Lysobacter gummosus TaxID=262324 RepID=UPI003629BCAD
MRTLLIYRRDPIFHAATARERPEWKGGNRRRVRNNQSSIPGNGMNPCKTPNMLCEPWLKSISMPRTTWTRNSSRRYFTPAAR